MNPLEMTVIFVPLAFIFGTIIGSFLNVLIWRLPREESIDGRSHCPHCSHTLFWYNLIPILSYAFSRGRCAYCSKSISARYPIIELITGLLFAAAMLAYPIADLFLALVYVKTIFVISVCIVVFVIDLEHYLILNKIIYPACGVLLVLLIALSFTVGDISILTLSVVAALSAFIPFYLLWYVSKGLWMGFGDVRFVVFMGLALGWPGTVVGLFMSFMIGAIIGVALIVAGKKQLSSKLPFGTFLTVAMVITLFFGSSLWQWYWNLFL